MTGSERTILYVDDDADDREFFFEVMKETDPQIDVVFAENGVEALQYLENRKNSSLPCLVVLDINMPLLDGKETFYRMRGDTVLKNLPVVVLSSSEKPDDKEMFNNLGIDFFTKPSNINYLNDIAGHMVKVCCR